MTKENYLNELKSRLKGLPKQDIEDRISFYSEMIDDRIEEGKSEEEAIEDIGSVEQVITQIASETKLLKLVKEKTRLKRKMRPWEIILIVLGFPIWFPLLVVALVLTIVAYILIWILVIVTYSVEISLIAASIWSLICLIPSGFNVMYIGIASLGIGLAIVMFFACKWATIFTLKLTKKIALSIKRKIVTKE